MTYKLHNRRYIGNKYKLLNFISTTFKKENIIFNSIADIFAGTGVVGEYFLQQGKKVIVNDSLYSNYIFYNAWLSNEEFSKTVIKKYIDYYNTNDDYIEDNYISDTFSDTYFSYKNARKIGSIRGDIEKNKAQLKKREYYILLSSLLYATDKIANTVGHFEAFLSSKPSNKDLELQNLDIMSYKYKPQIYNQDANQLVKKIKTDVVYIDPPYNARQYINFYHFLENLAEWKKPKVFGKTLKMEREAKKSNYSKAKALKTFIDLLYNIKAKYIVVSYNNTYKANSSSSVNKISSEEIIESLKVYGDVKVHNINYKHFNSGKTNFNNHKEYLYICKIYKKDKLSS